MIDFESFVIAHTTNASLWQLQQTPSVLCQHSWPLTKVSLLKPPRKRSTTWNCELIDRNMSIWGDTRWMKEREISPQRYIWTREVTITTFRINKFIEGITSSIRGVRWAAKLLLVLSHVLKDVEFSSWLPYHDTFQASLKFPSRKFSVRYDLGC